MLYIYQSTFIYINIIIVHHQKKTNYNRIYLFVCRYYTTETIYIYIIIIEKLIIDNNNNEREKIKKKEKQKEKKEKKK